MTAWDTTRKVLQSRLLMDEDGLTRKPRRGHCATCHLAVVGAITEAGYSMTVWPQPTTAWGEYQARKQGLMTYTVIWEDGMYYRDDWRIRNRHNPDRRHIHVEHRCGDQPPPSAVINEARTPTVTDKPMY